MACSKSDRLGYPPVPATTVSYGVGSGGPWRLHTKGLMLPSRSLADAPFVHRRPHTLYFSSGPWWFPSQFFSSPASVFSERCSGS